MDSDNVDMEIQAFYAEFAAELSERPAEIDAVPPSLNKVESIANILGRIEKFTKVFYEGNKHNLFHTQFSHVRTILGSFLQKR